MSNADVAYPALVKKVLPGAFLGFFAAVLFGAVLSSFNSLLNSSATLFGYDLYKHYFKKDATEKQTVKAGKKFGLLIAIISMCIAPFIANAPDGLFAYIQEALGSLSVPILAVVFIGIVTKHVPALGAKIALIGGVAMYLISQFILRPYVFGTENYIHFLHVMGILFVINIVIMLVIGKLYPKKDIYVPEVTEEIDITPWKHAKTIGIVIVLLVLSTYLIFR